MKYNYYYYIFILLLLSISEIHACDVMGSRACGQKPEKDDRDSDPVKYCIASRVYFECVHKKYRGCENKEKYEVAMESMLKGIRKRVDELLAFCSEKIEDYKFNIIWESPKKIETVDSIRNSAVSHPSSLQSQGRNDECQIKTINEVCQPLMINVKFNPSWNNINKRNWCQQTTIYFRCLKFRLDKCPQQDVQKQFQQLEHYLNQQININCPGGTQGCTRSSNDARCKIGLNQFNSNSRRFFSFIDIFLQSVLQIFLLLLLLI